MRSIVVCKGAAVRLGSLSCAVAALLAVFSPRPAWAAPPGAEEQAGEETARESAGAAVLTLEWWQEHIGVLVSDDVLRMGLKLVLGLLLFVGGWLVAKLVSWMIYRVLCKTDLDNKLADKLGINMLLEERAKEGKGDDEALERGVARVIFWLLMALVVVGVLDFAGLEQAASPIQRLVDTVIQALPLVGKAVLILVVAYVAGQILRKLVVKALSAARVDSRFAELDANEGAGPDEGAAEAKPFSDTAGHVVFWLVMVLGLAGAFDALEIKAISEPLSNAINTLMGLLPAVGIAALIGFGGYVLAKVVRVIVTRSLESLGLDKLVAKIKLDGLFGESTPSKVAGWLAMAFVIVQTVIAALARIGLETLSGPMTAMMGQFWDVLPALAVTALFVVLGVFVGRLLRGIVSKALEGVGFDRLMDGLGFGRIAERDDDLARPSGVVGFVVQVVVVLLAVVQGLYNLGLDTWAGYVDAFLVFAVTRVAVALAIVGVGFALGNYVRDLIVARQRGGKAEATAEADEGPEWMAEFARYTVLVFAFTMAVHQLGVAADFVLLSFALLFGALCLAGALAFGLGGREVAGEIVRERYRKAKQGGKGKTGSSLFGAGVTPPKPSKPSGK